MIWTKTKPDRAGWWWERIKTGACGPFIWLVQQTNKLGLFVEDDDGDIILLDSPQWNRSEWSSEPVPEPKEE